ncbi:hypothetical protein [Stackebrandtia soli]|uniref:hypothetical protein n=1 Tax=Stackebrandtia soli TaxID=1892856 RepID=UPI0039E8DDA5
MVEESYRFDDAAYDALGQAGVDWQSVTDVLYARRRVRQHLGAVLRIAAADRRGTWITVTLIEDGDDDYLVVSARVLDPDEAAMLSSLMGGPK